MGRVLGCLGHVVALRRTAVGPFTESLAARIEQLQSEDSDELSSFLLPVEAGLAALPALRVSSADAGRLARGQSVLLRGRDAPVLEGLVSVSAQGGLIALAEAAKGELRPRRIFNLPRR
jgi:tRNA pseudouridine55 synthase